MAADNLLRSFGEVHSRLFDHRPSVQGEINYFVKEFEERRKDRESERLGKSLHYSQSINRHLEDASNIQLQHYLPDLQREVNRALEATNKVLSNEVKPERDDWIKERRQQRVTEWSAFMDTMCERSQSVDNEVDSELSRVQNYYRDMEKKLNILDNVS